MEVKLSTTTVATVLLLFVSLIPEQECQSTTCTFLTESEGGERLDEREDTLIGTVLGRYDAVGDVESFSENPKSEYLDFEFVGGQLILTLLKSLTESLDAGITPLQVVITPQCRSGVVIEVGFVLNIIDINNRPPVFNANSFSINVQTPWPLQIPINFEVPISTTDGDFLEQNARTTFESTDDRVSITPTPVGFDEMPKFGYTLQLFLTDPILSGVDILAFQILAKNRDEFEVRVDVTLSVTKLNVNPPVFGQTLYKTPDIIDILPNAGDPVVLDSRIQAVDPENSEFLYDVGGQHHNLVDVNTQNGQLTFASITQGDIEALPNRVAIIDVVAREVDELPPFESTATVLIFFAVPGLTSPEPCPTCTTPIPQDSDTDCEETFWFIIALGILSVLLLGAIIVAIYFWYHYRKLSPNLSNLIRVDDSGLTPPPEIERWGDAKIDMGTTALPPTEATSVAQLYSPSHHSSPEALNTSLIQSNYTMNNPVPVFGSIESEPGIVAEEVVERPPSPKPDYRTKPDYTVKIHEIVEVIPDDVQEVNSDTEGDNTDVEDEPIQIYAEPEQIPDKVTEADESDRGDPEAPNHTQESRDMEEGFQNDAALESVKSEEAGSGDEENSYSDEVERL